MVTQITSDIHRCMIAQLLESFVESQINALDYGLCLLFLASSLSFVLRNYLGIFKYFTDATLAFSWLWNYKLEFHAFFTAGMEKEDIEPLAFRVFLSSPCAEIK